MKPTKAGEPMRLTSSLNEEIQPAWSPDGQHIAYIQIARDERAFSLMLIPALGGAGPGAAQIV